MRSFIRVLFILVLAVGFFTPISESKCVTQEAAKSNVDDNDDELDQPKSLERTAKTFFVEGSNPLSAFDADYRYGATIDKVRGSTPVRVYDLATGDTAKEFVLPFAFDSVLSIAPDVSSVCVLGGNKIEVWTSDAKPRRVITIKVSSGSGLLAGGSKFGGAWPYTAYLSPNRLLTLASANSKLQLHSLDDGNLVYETDALNLDTCPPQLSPDKSMFYYSADPKPGVTGGSNFTDVNFVNANTGDLAKKLSLVLDENFRVIGQTLSPDATKIVSRMDETNGASVNNYLAVWDAKTGGMLAKIPYRGSRGGSSWPRFQWVDNELVVDLQSSKKDTFNIENQTFVARWEFVPPSTLFAGSADVEAKRAKKIVVASGPEFFPDSNQMMYHYRVAGGFAVEIKRGLTQEIISNLKDMKRQYREIFLQDGDFVELVNVGLQGTGAPVNFITDVKGELDRALSQANKPIRTPAKAKLTVEIKDLLNGTIQGRFTLVNKTNKWFHDHFVYASSWEEFVKATGELKFRKDYLDFDLEELKIDTAMDKAWFNAHELKMADVVAKEKAKEPTTNAFDGARKSTLLRVPSERKLTKPWELNVYTGFEALDDRIANKPIPLYRLTDAVTVNTIKFAIFVTESNKARDAKQGPVRQAVILAKDLADNSFVERVDLASKRKLARTPVPDGTILLDVMPNATYWLTTDKKRKTLQVWKADSTGPEEPDTKLPQDIDCKDSKIASAYLAASNRIVTLQGDKTIVRAGTSTLNATGTRAITKPIESIVGDMVVAYEFENSKPLFSRKTELEKLTPTPARKYFLDIAGDQILFLNSSDGKVAQTLDAGSGEFTGITPDARFSVKEVSIRFDGKELALTHGGTFETGVWDLTTGKFKTLLPRGVEMGKWTDDFTMHRNMIYHVPTGNQVWTVVQPPKLRNVESETNDAWYLVEKGRDLCLTRHPIPGKGMNTYFSRYVKKVGVDRKKIAIKVAASGNASLDKQLETALTERLIKEGFEVITTGIKADDPILEAKIVIQEPPKPGDFTRLQLGFEEGNKSFLCYDRFITGELFVNLGKEGKFRLNIFGKKLSKIDYKINWDADDPEADLIKQFEADFVRNFANAVWPAEWIPNAIGTSGGRVHVIGESIFEDGKVDYNLSRHGKQALGKR